MCRQTDEEMPWKVMGQGQCGVSADPVSTADELIIHQAEDWSFCHHCRCNFPDYTAPDCLRVRVLSPRRQQGRHQKPSVLLNIVFVLCGGFCSRMWPLTTHCINKWSAWRTELLLKVLPWLIFHLDLPFVFIQLDNPDEQAAQIRRELDGRLQMAEQIAKVKKKVYCY